MHRFFCILSFVFSLSLVVVGSAFAGSTTAYSSADFTLSYDDNFITLAISPAILAVEDEEQFLSIPVLELIDKPVVNGHFFVPQYSSKPTKYFMFSTDSNVLGCYVPRPAKACLVNVLGSVILIPAKPSVDPIVPVAPLPSVCPTSTETSTTVFVDNSSLENRLDFIYTALLFLIGISIPVFVIWILYRAVKIWFEH